MLHLRNPRILRWYVINVCSISGLTRYIEITHTSGPNHVCLVAMGMVSHAAYNRNLADLGVLAFSLIQG